MTFRDILKRNPYIRQFGRYLRRVLWHGKYLYFIRSTPVPLSAQYGFDRGTPLDRYFIEDFLTKESQYIRGTCLEIHNNHYTMTFGRNRVTKSDVLDIDTSNINATLYGDLRNLTGISDNTYDTIILTQVLQFIDDNDSVIRECHRILKKGGVILVTLPCLSRADCISGIDGDYWRFTQASARYLFHKKFSDENVVIDFYGNARSGLYFYAGLAIEDTPAKVLETKDGNFPTIITVKATKI
jgi:ubiquinone/menaquinone biosynthesis C-methylase UbiE